MSDCTYKLWSRNPLRKQIASANKEYGLLDAHLSTFADDDVRRALRLVSEVVLKNLLCSSSVTGLSIESGTRVVRYHAVTTVEGVLHGAPWVVSRRGLHIPDITSIAVDLARLNSRSNSILVGDSTTGGVDYPSILLEVLQQICVDEATSSFVQRAVDSDDITLNRSQMYVISKTFA